jgi:dynein heavy chain, axonemal
MIIVVSVAIILNDAIAYDDFCGMQGIVGSFEAAPQLWEGWWRSAEPETTELPGEWEPKCDELQRMILLRCLRSYNRFS